MARALLSLARFEADRLGFSLNFCVSIGYTLSMKDVGLRIRVQRDLREQFLEVCRAEDKPAAQVIREFMREYVNRHENAHSGTGARSSVAKAKRKLI